MDRPTATGTTKTITDPSDSSNSLLGSENQCAILGALQRATIIGTGVIFSKGELHGDSLSLVAGLVVAGGIWMATQDTKPADNHPAVGNTPQERSK